tara:strand:+ start:126 stop:431 length:306 start_codon:yes stop_codon:yes gene_type:complete
MQIKQGTYCPLLKKDCIGLECSWMNHIVGRHPQTGEELDEWDCTIKWLPFLLLENANMQRQTGAAIESFRNETVERMDKPSIRPATDPLKLGSIDVSGFLN